MSTIASSPSGTRTTSATSSAATTATVIGTVLQLAMVIAGHWVEFIKLNVFAIGGTLSSAVAGALGGAIAGGAR